MTQAQTKFIEEIVDAYQLKLRRIAMHLTNDEWLSADLTQEVFESAARKVESLMQHPAVEKWLMRALVYLVRREILRAYRRHEVSEDHIETIAETELALPLEMFLPKGLTDKEREILILRLEYRIEYAQIAKQLHTSEAACRKRMDRAIKHCEVLLKKDYKKFKI